MYHLGGKWAIFLMRSLARQVQINCAGGVQKSATYVACFDAKAVQLVGDLLAALNLSRCFGLPCSGRRRSLSRTTAIVPMSAVPMSVLERAKR